MCTMSVYCIFILYSYVRDSAILQKLLKISKELASLRRLFSNLDLFNPEQAAPLSPSFFIRKDFNAVFEMDIGIGCSFGRTSSIEVACKHLEKIRNLIVLSKIL